MAYKERTFLKRFISLVILAISAFPAIAQTTFTSSTSGDWHDGGTWGNTSPGVQGTDWPAATDHAIIAYGHTVSLQQNESIVNFEITLGGQFDFNAFTLTPSGTVIPFVAQTTGDFDVVGTWLNGSAPGVVSDDIVVTVGVRVTLVTGTILNNLSVNSAAVFDDDGNTIQVDGNIFLNGTVAGSNNLDFSGGVGTSIDGAGGHSASNFDINGSTTILSTAYLTFGQTVNMTNAGTTTNNGTIILNSDLKSTGSASTWINAANSTLKSTLSVFNGGGNLNASAIGNTVIYSQAGNQTIKDAVSSTYYNLTIAGTDIKTMSTGTIILGDLEITSGTLSAPTTFSLAGDFSSTGTFDENTGTITFNGTSDQTITRVGGETFYNVVLDKASGALNLANNVIASNTLTLTQGIIDADASILTLGTGTGAARGVLTHTAGQIIGQFERWVDQTATDIIFPVGSTLNENPATINFTGITTGGTVIFQFVASIPGNAGLSLVDGVTVYNTFVDGYWDMSTANSFDLGANSFTLNLDGTGFAAFTIDADTRLLTRADAGSNWLAEGSHIAAVSPVVNRSGLSTMPAQYAFGDDFNCTPPSTSAITGTSDVCTGDSPVAYSVVNTSGSSYAWTITGGTIASGDGTSAITVTWGATGMVGNVRVVEDNISCTLGPAVDFPVNINSIAPTSITGKTIIAETTLGETYSVTGLAGYSYTWTITGGSQATGGTTNSITIDWGLAGIGNVSVVAQSATCSAAPAIDMDVVVYDVINSAQTGDWDVGTTWETGLVPATDEHARILNGHVVTITANETIHHLIINIGGTISNPSKTLTVDGDFTNNWFYSGVSKALILAGINTTIDGTGTIQIPGSEIQITSGNKTIASTSVLSIPFGGLDIGIGITVTNKGSVSMTNAITGSNAASSIWINDANANLTITGSIFGGNKGLLDATASGNHVIYNGGAQTVFAKAAANTYYHLTLEGSGAKTLDGDIQINGDFDISGTASLDGATNSAAVTMGGTIAQSIIGLSSGMDFYDLIINNTFTTSPQIATSGVINVTNSATFTDGIISNNGSFRFTDATATSTANSYIDGPVAFIAGGTNTAFTYPLGDGSVWARLGVSSVTNGDQFTGQYFYTDPLVAIGSTIDATDFPGGTAIISQQEYWQLDRDVGAGSANVTLYWEDGTRSGITDITDLTITKHDGTDWGTDGGIATSTTGSAAAGTVTTSTPYLLFSPFTFASPLGNNALPVELVYFRGKLLAQGAVLEWQTASELDNDFFEVEVSTDGENYTTLAHIDGQGTTTEVTNYEFTDRYPSSGLNYYRLRQVDFNGDFTYSNIISVMNDAPPKLFFSAYPQPASSHLTLQLMAIDDTNMMNLVIYNMNGRIIKNISIDPTIKQLPLDITDFTNGLYLVRLVQANQAFNGKLLIQK